MAENIKVFISYSWDSEEHKQWVKSLTDKLIQDGVDASLDQYDLTLGDRLPHFMEQRIAESNHVLIICTPKYKIKSDQRAGGVGYEGHIISGELLSSRNERKFIPVIREGTPFTSMPKCLEGKLAIDLTGDRNFNDDHNYKDLITTLYGNRSKPPMGTKPAYIPNSSKPVSQGFDSSEDIKILGIITDEVTVPKNDGTRGSALYKIPFKLSKKPSDIWKKIFVATWNMPPSFTSMHRPKIASVYGDTIYLDGTTIEEVRDYHRKTLLLCVEEANKREKQILAEEERRRKRQEEFEKAQSQKIHDVIKDIEF